MLEADHIKCWQRVRKGGRGYVGNAGRLRRRLAGTHRIPMKATPRIAESELIHLVRRQRPAVFCRNTVCAGQRISDEPRRDESAAVRQGSAGAGVVSEKLIAPENPLVRSQVVVKAQAKLLLVCGFIRHANEVIAGRFLPIGANTLGAG